VSGRNSPEKCGFGPRGLGLDAKSRMRRETPVRFREGLGVQFPRATRLITKDYQGHLPGLEKKRDRESLLLRTIRVIFLV